MATNDILLIDGIIDERIEECQPSKERGEVFEFFVFEQSLKDYNLSDEEILFGSVDGRADGGIDGFYIFVNGHYLTDIASFFWPKTNCELEIFILTCKHQDTFKQAPLDNLNSTLIEFLDLSLENSELKGEYSDIILSMRDNLRFAYRKVSPRLNSFKINLIYASRGDTSIIGETIVARSNQIVGLIQGQFGNCEVNFKFIGSSQLIESYRKLPNFSLSLPFKEFLSEGERYVLLVKIKDYFNFINNEGSLRRYLFDSNIRAFMGLNSVNTDIRNTLNDSESPDFWWLNNGITILATGATVIGKTIQVEDIQIVNGLQTTESIFNHFIIGGKDPKDRLILVKIIVTNESLVRDAIIRATNNQTQVETSALHATDKIQRDIEEVLKLNDFYYERRTNFYKNQGIESEKVISPLYLSTGYITLILKNPKEATGLKSRFIVNDDKYNKVFDQNSNLEVWPQIVKFMKKIDKFLFSIKKTNSKSERFIKHNRQFLAFLVASKILNNFNFNVADFIKINLDKITDETCLECFELIEQITINRLRFSNLHFIKMCQIAEKKWEIKGFEQINKLQEYKADFNRQSIEISDEFVEQVRALLPIQPWKPKMHLEILTKLNCSQREYHAVVNKLISDGIFYRQRDGVVYDSEGDILLIDEERVKDISNIQPIGKLNKNNE